MYKIKETIVVEGIYDKIKLSRFIDAVIIVTNGFCVFSDDRILESIKKMADETGIVILTDSDSAGFKIRNYIKLVCEYKIILSVLFLVIDLFAFYYNKTAINIINFIIILIYCIYLNQNTIQEIFKEIRKKVSKNK